jgi:hypothetical protein
MCGGGGGCGRVATGVSSFFGVGRMIRNPVGQSRTFRRPGLRRVGLGAGECGTSALHVVSVRYGTNGNAV